MQKVTHWTYSFLLTIFVLVGYSQGNMSGIRPELRDTILKVANHNIISGGIVGYDGKKDPYCYTQIWLWKNATDNELYKLLDYPNGTIKAVAYAGLLYRKIEDSYDIFYKAIEDSIYSVHYQSGCVVRSIHIADYLSNNVFQVSLHANSPPMHESKYEFISEEEIILLQEKYNAFYNK